MATRALLDIGATAPARDDAIDAPALSRGVLSSVLGLRDTWRDDEQTSSLAATMTMAEESPAPPRTSWAAGPLSARMPQEPKRARQEDVATAVYVPAGALLPVVERTRTNVVPVRRAPAPAPALSRPVSPQRASSLAQPLRWAALCGATFLAVFAAGLLVILS